MESRLIEYRRFEVNGQAYSIKVVPNKSIDNFIVYDKSHNIICNSHVNYDKGVAYIVYNNGTIISLDYTEVPLDPREYGMWMVMHKPAMCNA